MARRVEASPSLLLFSLLLLLLAGETVQLVQGQKTWCVAKPSSDDATLLANINYACSQVDCSIIQRGCPCFFPDNLISHASIAMNLYYQCRGRNNWNCHFKNSGLVTTTDPSNYQMDYISTPADSQN
ncbi:major pollen allergen Ole e 10 isoform X1 [Elaeis guineensis]|uniref:major pollen allergen Ole e 10 isoform X1 n=1 Tax=Elaeis guineensis var. tenera TaxID=51953 RepID=UPI000579DA17